jgi:HD-GYP domain-containing protein (c-di-GMP phosphodiesterase class II)
MIYGLLSIIIFLLVVLSIVLNKLYQLKRVSYKFKKTDSGDVKKLWQKFDELLLNMISIHDLGTSGIGMGEEKEFYDMALEKVCSVVNACRGSVMLFHEGSGILEIVSSKGISKKLIENVRLRPGEGIAGRAFKKGEIIFVTNPKKNPDYNGFLGYDEQQEPFVAIPLKTRKNVIGVLNIHLPKDRTNFSDWELKFLSILADEIALAIDNIKLYQSIEKFYLELVETLAKIIDVKDAYTADHATRARIRAVKLARKLNVAEKMVKNIEYAALLHDMGKIGIDERILTKPGKLTDDEYKEIKRHPQIGYNILSPIEFLRPVAEIILYHHEWYNGNGYPDGLKGDEIPLGSRIISVIDAWDAMTSDRPYRKSLSKETAIEELKKGAGIQFDPKVVNAFLELMEEEEINKASGS